MDGEDQRRMGAVTQGDRGRKLEREAPYPIICRVPKIYRCRGMCLFMTRQRSAKYWSKSTSDQEIGVMSSSILNLFISWHWHHTCKFSYDMAHFPNIVTKRSWNINVVNSALTEGKYHWKNSFGESNQHYLICWMNMLPKTPLVCEAPKTTSRAWKSTEYMQMKRTDYFKQWHVYTICGKYMLEQIPKIFIYAYCGKTLTIPSELTGNFASDNKRIFSV